MARSKTREEILSAAVRLFAAVGFKGTSLHDIAVEVGCSKATLLYHFDSKDAILAAIIAPPARDFAVLDGRLASCGPHEARDLAIEGFVDLVLAYRREIALIYHDLPQLLERPAFADLRPMTTRLVAAFAGRSEDPAAQIGAAVVLSGISTVVLDRADCHTDDDLRSILIDLARRALVPSATRK